MTHTGPPCGGCALTRKSHQRCHLPRESPVDKRTFIYKALSSRVPAAIETHQSAYLETISVFIPTSGIAGVFLHVWAGWSCPSSWGSMSDSGKILKHFLCLEVMGLETDEVNELMAPKHWWTDVGRNTWILLQRELCLSFGRRVQLHSWWVDTRLVYWPLGGHEDQFFA